MSSYGTVLITGANGFIAFDCVMECLVRGYHVRAVVRRPEAVTKLEKYEPLQQYIAGGIIDFIVIKDQTIPGAYDEAVKGCTYIIHTASPMPVANLGDLVPQAVGGVRTIIEAAEANSSVKRLVITSSVLALRPFETVKPSSNISQARIAGDLDFGPTMTADDVAPLAGELKSDAVLERYVASKIAARNYVLDYASHRPSELSHFSIIQLCPGYICGPQRLAKNKTDAFVSTNIYLMYPFFDYKIGEWYDQPKDTDAPNEGLALHIADCTAAHVNALDENRVSGHHLTFLLATNAPHGIRWEEQEHIMKEHLPQISQHTPFAAKLGK